MLCMCIEERESGEIHKTGAVDSYIVVSMKIFNQPIKCLGRSRDAAATL